MRVSSATIFTLATLAASNITTKVNAATPNHEAQKESADSVVVPTTEETPPQVENVAAPETEEVQQFSQNHSRVESGKSNNLPVIGRIQNKVEEIQNQEVPESKQSDKSNKFNKSSHSNKSNKFNKSREIDNSPVVVPSSPALKKNISDRQVSVQSTSSQNISTQSISNQSISTQNISSQSTSSQNISNQSTSSQNISNQSISNQSTSNQNISNQSISNQSTSDKNNYEKNISDIKQTTQTPQIQRDRTIPNNNDLVVPAVEVRIVGATQELEAIIRQVIKTQVGGDTNQSQLQKDVTAILNTGLFSNANVSSGETEFGLKVLYRVEPLIVRSLQLSGAKALKYPVAIEPFKSQIGQPISPSTLKNAVKEINQWYKDNGYSLARVLEIKPNPQGSLTLQVAEGVVGEIKFEFVNDEGETVNDQGKAVKGRTKPDFLRQQLQLKPGEVFQDKVVRQDLQKLYGLGLFESANVALDGDANTVDVIYKLKEIGARSVNLGGNFNADQGIVGTFTYRDQNVRGTNDNLGVNVQAGRRHLGFDAKFTSPYRSSNPDRLGYSINAFRRRGLSETFDDEIKLANGDKVRQGKFGASFQLQKPIDDWNATLGLNYTRTSIRDRKGKVTAKDELNNPLTLSDTGVDDLTTVSLSATKDQRDNRLNPTKGSVLTLSSEQSIPLGLGNISMNRLQANYSQYVPVKLFKSDKTQVFAFNAQAGTVIGDLPPYETFNLGGSHSVRGYGGGKVGSGRSYILASAEYRFPLPVVKSLGGVVFADFASDLGSGDTVLADPAGTRGKPGSGFGVGAGIRLNSPLGLIRADYGISDQGESQLHFGFGHRF